MAKVELPALKPAMQRRELIQLTACAVLTGLFLSFVSHWVTGAIVTVTIVCIGLSYRYPAWGLWMFLIYMPFAGTITYAIDGNHTLLQLVKDAFYLPALIAIAQSPTYRRQILHVTKPLLLPLLFLLAVCLITVLAVNLPEYFVVRPLANPLLVGLVGFKAIFGYVPLIFCAYYLIRSQKELYWLMRLHIILVLICCSLAFLQYLLLVNRICPGSLPLTGQGLVKASLEARCLVGGSLLYNPELSLIRLPGTFVAPWQWGWFLISGSFLTFAAGVSDPNRRWRQLSLVAIAFVFILAVISGQRIALGLVPAIFIFLQILSSTHKKWLKVELGLVVLITILVINNLGQIQQSLDSFINRWNASPPPEFIVAQFLQALQEQQGWIGKGLGSATNAARFFSDPAFIETYFAKILYELGPLGIVGILAVVSVLTYLTFKAYRSLQDPHLQPLALCLWAFILLISYFPYYYPLDVDPVAVYYWFFAGVLLKLPKLDVHSS